MSVYADLTNAVSRKSQDVRDVEECAEQEEDVERIEQYLSHHDSHGNAKTDSHGDSKTDWFVSNHNKKGLKVYEEDVVE